MSNSTNPTNTPSPTAQLIQQGVLTTNDKKVTNSFITEPSGLAEESSLTSTGKVAGVSMNNNKSRNVAFVFVAVGSLLLAIVFFLSKGYSLKSVLQNISQVFKKLRR